MRLYHGSIVAISSPDVHHSRKNLDFGCGFYTTSIKSQAERWALRKAAFEDGSPVVSVYEADEAFGNLNVLAFPDCDAEWVEFVCDCRRGGNRFSDYDLIVGGVADDKVYEAVNMYFNGLWGMGETLSALKFYEVNDQYCFVSQRAIDHCLSFTGSYEVHRGD